MNIGDDCIRHFSAQILEFPVLKTFMIVTEDNGDNDVHEGNQGDNRFYILREACESKDIELEESRRYS